MERRGPFSTTMRRSFAGSFVAAAAVLAACGGGAEAPAAKTPAERPEREPATVEEAQADLDRARADLEGTPPGASDFGRPTAPAEGPRPSPAAPEKATSSGAGAPSGAMGDCARLCRALSSMQRAQAAICRMAGDEDARCVEAKKAVDDSLRRLAQCRC